MALDPKGGINYLHCNVPGSTAALAAAVTTNDATLFGQVGATAVQQGCLLNMVDGDDVFVTRPWLKGVEAGHVVSAPNTEDLAGLYPG